MGLHSCSPSGEVDDSKFSEPLPWIGVYIAAASLLCSLLMGIDTFHGFRRRKLWFPSRFFSLNATSLTLLSVATKLTVDLNTSMPRRQDQLTKLSGTVLVCTVMGNFMSSLGTMNESEMISNVVALGILVVTVIVNIAIQMSTGVIYVFLPEHAIIMFFMLVLLVIMCSTALTAPTAKKLLENKYNEIHNEQSSGEQYDEIRDEQGSGEQYDEIRIEQSSGEQFDIKKLREDVRKYWMMAHTSSPQYVVGRSATCTASGAFCLLGALILLQAVARSITIRSLHFCKGKSDYTWSMTMVLISQAIAIGVGTIAPAIRWFNAISFRSPSSQSESCKGEFKVEKYWVQRLEEWKENPLPFHIGNRRFRKIVHITKNQILSVLIQLQCLLVFVSKLIRLASILPVSWLSGLSACCKRPKGKKKGSESGSNEDLSRFVLHLEGEEDLVQLIMTNGREDALHWIRKGKRRPPNYLVELLKKCRGSQGEVEFDNNQVSRLSVTEKPLHNCWALPVVILTSVAITIAPLHIKKGTNTLKSLRRGVDESLKYVRLIEKQLDVRGLINMRKAADIVWLSIDVYDCWLGNDIKKLARTEKTAEKILEKLADIGEQYVLHHLKDEKDKDPRHWPPKMLAANSMYRICQTILLKDLGTADQIFEWLQKTIADILGACLANLPRVISMECICSSIESREESVREAAYLLGEAENILTEGEMMHLDPGFADIDEWISKQNR